MSGAALFATLIGVLLMGLVATVLRGARSTAIRSGRAAPAARHHDT